MPTSLKEAVRLARGGDAPIMLGGHNAPPPGPLVGLTAGEAEAKLDQVEATIGALERQVAAGYAELGERRFAALPSGPEQAPQPSAWRRLADAAGLWLKQALCPHPTPRGEKVALVNLGTAPLWRYHCAACGRIWAEVG